MSEIKKILEQIENNESQDFRLLKPILSNVISLKKPFTIEKYKDWLKQNYHGDMSYLSEHLPFKENPNKLSQSLPEKIELNSVISLAYTYLPHPSAKQIFPSLNIAKYAQGMDYHYWLKEALLKISDRLKQSYPKEEFLVFTDSGPVLERDFAYQAGHGWFGKNTCIINRKHGSFFLLGEIFTTLETKPTIDPNKTEQNKFLSVSPNFCGTCDRCIQACPTGALKNPYELDARLCISYHTIESRQIPEKNLYTKFGNLFFGCDICQDVCPWNKKPLNQLTAQDVSKQDLIQDLNWILLASGKQIEKKIKGSALMRSGSFGLKRNALIVANNLQLTELVPAIKNLIDHHKLGPLAKDVLETLLN